VDVERESDPIDMELRRSIDATHGQRDRFGRKRWR
jgi:hypothetical protein